MESLKILFPMFVILIIIFWGLTKSIITGGIKNLLLGVVLLIFIFTGTTLGLRVGNAIDDIQNSGAYTSWVLLNSPVKFTQITDISYDGIWAQTADNKLYFWGFGYLCSSNLNVKCLQWIETINIPSNAHENDSILTIKKGKACPDIQDYPKNFPGKIAECVLIDWNYLGGGVQSSYFVLLKDGTLWEWHHPQKGGHDMLPPLGIGIGLLIGFLLGILTGILFLRILQKRYKITLTWFG